MSQEDVLKILKSLGGEATLKEISAEAKRKYPKRTLYHYVGLRLRRLRKWGTVDNSNGKWRITNL